MKKKIITYKERAMFYNNEVSSNDETIDFLNYIREKYSIRNIILCPSASGGYLETISKLFKNILCIDIEKNMIKILNRNLKKKKINNVKTIVLDMNNLNSLNLTSDCIISLNQGIQYLSLVDLEIFLVNSYSITEYIILDLFDFTKSGILSYYDSNVKDDMYYFSKKFKMKTGEMVRYNKHIHTNNSIKIGYKYINENRREISYTNYELYNYKVEEINDLLTKTKKYILKEKLTFKKGNYILILERI